jgi:CheY-like chemotaxis protein
VLLIDDDAALLEMIRLISERSREITIQTAQSAKEALGTLAQKSFDVIIVDYEMPEISGIEFLKILRKHGNITPVIVFTDVDGEHPAIEALNNGANFLLKKGEDVNNEYRELVTAVNKAMELVAMGKDPGTMQRIIADMINFSSDPGFAVDRDGKVIAWNDSMEQLTDVPAREMVGKGDNIYSEPFFGMRKKMLVDLFFESDDEIKREKYMLISRIPKGPIIAVTRGMKKNSGEWTNWMKAMLVYDSQGQVIASVSTVRDVTATFGDITIGDTGSGEAARLVEAVSTESRKKKTGIFDKVLGRTSSLYKEGVILFVKEKKYAEAIALFDTVLETDNKLAHVWNDRGTCFREMGDLTSALKSQLRAVELFPDNSEYLYDLGETLEKIGVMYMSTKYLGSAIQTFKMVVNQMPNNASAWNHLGICHKAMGKEDESKFYTDRARDIMLRKKDTPLKRKRDEFTGE